MKVFFCTVAVQILLVCVYETVLLEVTAAATVAVAVVAASASNDASAAPAAVGVVVRSCCCCYRWYLQPLLLEAQQLQLHWRGAIYQWSKTEKNICHQHAKHLIVARRGGGWTQLITLNLFVPHTFFPRWAASLAWASSGQSSGRSREGTWQRSSSTRSR